MFLFFLQRNQSTTNLSLYPKSNFFSGSLTGKPHREFVEIFHYTKNTFTYVLCKHIKYCTFIFLQFLKWFCTFHKIPLIILFQYCAHMLLLFSPTLCNPMDCSTPGFPDLHYLLELAQTHGHWVIDAIQPSQPLSHPSPPALSLSQHQSRFQRVSSSHQVDKELKLQLQHQSFQWIPNIDLL